jgi:NADPH:quinone reductase
VEYLRACRRCLAGTVIATAGSESKLALAKSLGADVAIDYGRDDWTKEVLDATGGRGADIALDGVGGPIFSGSLEVLAPFGRLVNFGMSSAAVPPAIDVTALYGGNHTVSAFSLYGWFADGSTLPDSLTQLIAWVAGGELKIPKVTEFPLEHAVDAHRAIQNRETTGKVVLTPWW